MTPSSSAALLSTSQEAQGKNQSELTIYRPSHDVERTHFGIVIVPLNKLDVELPREGGHLALHAQLPLPDAHGDDLVVSRAVPHAVEDVQVLHHNMAV